MSKTIKIFVPIFLSFILIYSYVTPFIKTSENISQEVFRLHILANSDSDEDQSLKLKVRDKILTESESLFINCKNLNDVINVSKNNIDYFEKLANECIKENGYNYEYNALKIEIGEAKGHNWWCVMFPAICLPAVSDDEINSILNEDEIELINSNNKYEIRFKIVEIYEKIKSKLQ